MTDAVIRVVLADDHPVVRGGLRALLESLPAYDVVGEAVDGDAAVREVQLTRPDVVLMDVQMPDVDGLEATRRIREAVPEVAVLVLTMFDDDDTVFAAMKAGAQGYLLKGAEQGEIDRAIRAVVAGEAIFGPGVAARVLRHFAEPLATPDDVPFPQLTDREREVLDLVAAGRRNAAIAEALFLSPKTVANHISSIFAKLAVADRSAAIVRARDEGLGRTP
ncbi:MAG: response regulator [Aeromicrobium sp.]